MSADKDDKEANRSPTRSTRSPSETRTTTSNTVTTQNTQNDDGNEEKSVKNFFAKLKDSDLTPSQRAVVTGQLARHLVSGVCSLAIFAMVIFIAIFMIIMGVRNLENCPVEKMIPIWLIVFGAFICLGCILAIGLAIVDRNGGSVAVLRTWIEAFFILFWFVWLIVGSVWTYSVYHEVRLVYEEATQTISHDQEKYCDRPTYNFTFFLITLNWAIIAFWLVFSCCLFCCLTAVFAIRPPSEGKSPKSQK